MCPKILSGEIPLYLDEVARERGGAWRNYSLAASPLKSSLGEILGISLVVTDITQLKKAEAEMLKRLVEVRGLRRVASAAGAWFDRRAFHRQVTADIAHLFGAEKCIIFRWGERTGHLEAQVPAYGLTARELRDLALDIGDPDDPSSLWLDLEERDYILLNEGDKAPDSMVEASSRVDRLAAMMAVLRVSGRVHGTILVAGRDDPFSDQEGQLAAAFAVPVVLAIEDDELNQRLLDRVQQLEAAREELARVARTAESMRMPLTVIRGYMELLLDGALGPVSDRQVSTVSELLEKTRELGNRLNQLLPSQYMLEPVRYESIDLVSLLHKVHDKWLAPVRLAGLDLGTTWPPSSSQRYQTTGDPDALFGVFDALLDNAVKYSSSGSSGGTISMSVHESKDIVYVKVQDPGVGISTQDLLQIWQPRHHANSSGPLSLAEVKRIVEDHGGQVWVESQPSRGSSFYVVLPKVTVERPIEQVGALT
jgi:signal transduction histidine kinase